MKRFNWTSIRLVLMFGLVVFLFSFTSNRNGSRKLTQSKVFFVGENQLFIKILSHQHYPDKFEFHLQQTARSHPQKVI